MPEPSASPRRRELERVVAAGVAATRFTDVRWFAEIDSTNRYLLDEARAGAAEGVVAVADLQTAGRGRLGRTWESPRDASLLVSVLLRPSIPPDRQPLLVTAAALAAADAVGVLAAIDARVKWPNDLLVGDRKLGGVLAEAAPGPVVVVGLGLNVAWERIPPELAGIATACNLESPTPVARPELLAEWLRRYDARLGRSGDDAGRAELLAEARRRSATLGRVVRVETGERTVVGTAVAISDSGHLVVRTDTGDVDIAAGDVVLLRDHAP